MRTIKGGFNHDIRNIFLGSGAPALNPGDSSSNRRNNSLFDCTVEGAEMRYSEMVIYIHSAFDKKGNLLPNGKWRLVAVDCAICHKTFKTEKRAYKCACSHLILGGMLSEVTK